MLNINDWKHTEFHVGLEATSVHGLVLFECNVILVVLVQIFLQYTKMYLHTLAEAVELVSMNCCHAIYASLHYGTRFRYYVYYVLNHKCLFIQTALFYLPKRHILNLTD